MTKKELFESLTEEQKAKFKACKSREEFEKALKEECIELSPEILEEVSGGGYSPIFGECDWICDECGH